MGAGCGFFDRESSSPPLAGRRPWARWPLTAAGRAPAAGQMAAAASTAVRVKQREKNEGARVSGLAAGLYTPPKSVGWF
jgi:hypothetical protein